MRPLCLVDVEDGKRIRLADGRVAIASAVILGDRFVREYLGDEEWLPGKWAAKTGPMEVQRGDQLVEVV